MVRNFETQATTFCLFITPRPDDRTSPSLFPQHPLPDKTNSLLNQTGRMPAPAPAPSPGGSDSVEPAEQRKAALQQAPGDWWHPGVTSAGHGQGASRASPEQRSPRIPSGAPGP